MAQTAQTVEKQTSLKPLAIILQWNRMTLAVNRVPCNSTSSEARTIQVAIQARLHQQHAVRGRAMELGIDRILLVKLGLRGTKRVRGMIGKTLGN